MITRTITIDFEQSYEFTYEVTHWGSPASAPSLSYPGDPAEPPEVEIIGAIGEDGETFDWADFDETEQAKVLEAIFEELAEEDNVQDYD